MYEENLVSIIVPIYNVEKYVEQCVRSITKQTYKNIEIILVDDGSPDRCGEILDSLKLIDQRIVVLHKQNEGVSAARNDGIAVSNGKYIIFVDGDDWIDDRFVEDFVRVIEELGTDMALSYGYLVDNNRTSSESNKKERIKSVKAIEQLYLGKIGVAVWNKIYKKEFLKRNNITFHTEFWFAEGMTFNVECFIKCEYVGVCNLERYHQVTNPESAVRKFNLSSWHCGLKAMEYQRGLLNPNDSRLIASWNYHYREYNTSILYGLYRSGQAEFQNKEIKRCVYNLHHNVLYPLKVDIDTRAKIKSLILSCIPVLGTKLIVMREIGYLPTVCDLIIWDIMKMNLKKTSEIISFEELKGDILINISDEYEIKFRIKKKRLTKKQKNIITNIQMASAHRGETSTTFNNGIKLYNLNDNIDVKEGELNDDIVLFKDKKKYFIEIKSKEGAEFLHRININTDKNDEYKFQKCYEVVLENE